MYCSTCGAQIADSSTSCPQCGTQMRHRASSMTPPTAPVPSNFKPHRGTAVLVLGILSLVVCGILGIVAWVMGNNDLREMDAGTMDPSGRSLTNAGRICGMIASILIIVVLSIWLIVAFAGVAFAACAMTMPTSA